jgi:hypothetical protein
LRVGKIICSNEKPEITELGYLNMYLLLTFDQNPGRSLTVEIECFTRGVGHQFRGFCNE